METSVTLVLYDVENGSHIREPIYSVVSNVPHPSHKQRRDMQRIVHRSLDLESEYVARAVHVWFMPGPFPQCPENTVFGP